MWSHETNASQFEGKDIHALRYKTLTGLLILFCGRLLKAKIDVNLGNNIFSIDKRT